MKRPPERAKAKSGTNLEHAHLLNQRVVLDTVRLNEPVSRVEIARLTALSNQTLFNITDRLLRIGLIQDFGRKTAQRGQPAKLFEINPDAAFSIGIHFERDHIAAVLADFIGHYPRPDLSRQVPIHAGGRSQARTELDQGIAAKEWASPDLGSGDCLARPGGFPKRQSNARSEFSWMGTSQYPGLFP